VTIKANQHLKSLAPETMWAVMTHPAQQANVARIARLIECL
jgi:hypothetical protein